GVRDRRARDEPDRRSAGGPGPGGGRRPGNGWHRRGGWQARDEPRGGARRIHVLDRARIPARPPEAVAGAGRGLAGLYVTPLHYDAYAPVAQVDRAAVS